MVAYLVKIIALSMILVSCGDIRPKGQERKPVPVPGPTGPEGPAGQDGEEGTAGQNGIDGQDGADGKDAEPCTVQQHEDGATITCPDGTIAEIYHGQPGQNGIDGQDGQNGADGQDGVDGQDGQDAEPCTVEAHVDGATITCPDGTTVEIYHGQDGQSGGGGGQGGGPKGK